VSPDLAVGDIRTYLLDNGWQREPLTWHDASIWSHTDGHDVLVPPHDDWLTPSCLHDRPESDDRWRIRIRGELRMRGGTGIGRTVWVRLNGQAPYDRAIAAHRARQRVRARGDLSSLKGRVELIVEDDDFDILQEDG
jgi:hypothetical protein